jgi:hypothetical protein
MQGSRSFIRGFVSGYFDQHMFPFVPNGDVYLGASIEATRTIAPPGLEAGLGDCQCPLQPSVSCSNVFSSLLS